MNVSHHDVNRLYQHDFSNWAEQGLLKSRIFGAIARHEKKVRVFRLVSAGAWFLFCVLATVIGVSILNDGGQLASADHNHSSVNAYFSIANFLQVNPDHNPVYKPAWAATAAFVLLLIAIGATVVYWIERRPSPHRSA